MLLLLIWRHVDFYINSRITTAVANNDARPNDKSTEFAASQTLRGNQALNESKSGWGSSLFSPFRRKADSSSPAPGAERPSNSGSVGVPLASSTVGGATGANAKSVLGVSALGGRGLGSTATRTSDEVQAALFRAEAATALEPLLDRLEALQLVRGPIFHFSVLFKHSFVHGFSLFLNLE
jgi:hypothetical protein